MSTGLINILAVVDVQSILAGGNRWYVVDNDSSSESEGSQSLVTECTAGDTLYFRVAPITEGQSVKLITPGPGPGGAYVFGFNQPVHQGGGLWSWQTQNSGRGGYSLALLVGGVQSLTVTGSVHAAPASVMATLPVLEEKAADLGGAFQIIDVAVAVNTDAIMAGLGVNDSIFMMDNSPTSSGQGTFELNTGCSAGDTLRWHCLSINGTDTVTITGFEQSNGNAFGENSPIPVGDQWTWKTVNPGSNSTYQMRILINNQFSASWDPFISVSNATSAALVNERPAARATA